MQKAPTSPPREWPRCRRWSWVTRVALGVGAALVLLVLAAICCSGLLINRYARPRVERSFAAAHPGASLRIARLESNFARRELVFHNVIYKSAGAERVCSLARCSVRGVRWRTLLFGGGGRGMGLRHSTFTATNLVVDFPKSEYSLRCPLLSGSLAEGELIAKEIVLRPSLSDEEFIAAREFRRTRFHFTVPECRIEGFHTDDWLRGKGFHAHSLQLNKATLETLVDREKPVNTQPRKTLSPAEFLARFKRPLTIERIQVRNGAIHAGQRFGSDGPKGVLTFTALELSAEGLQNQSLPGSTLLVKGETKLMDAGTLKALLEIPLSTPEWDLRYSGSLTAMDLTRLNPFVVVAGRSRIRRGALSDASFDIHVQSGRATGKVWGHYQNFELTFLDRETGSDKGLVNRVKTFVTDHVILRTSNMPDPAHPRAVGVVDYARKPNERYLHFIWFALRSGIVDLLGLSDYVKASH